MVDSLNKKRAITIGCAVCALVALAALAYSLSGPKEPEYRGRKLSYWLALPMQPMPPNSVGGRAANPATVEAVRNIGTNALPFLVHWISYEPPEWQSAAVRWLKRRRLGPSWVLSAFTRSEDRANAAELGFAFLGANANAAVPALSAAVARQKGTAAAQRCLGALWSIQQAGGGVSPVVPQLLALEVARSKSVSGPAVVRSYTGCFDYKPDYVRGLSAALRRGSREVREEALIQLYVYCAVCRGDPELLKAGLKDQSKDVTELAARLIGRLAERQALPGMETFGNGVPWLAKEPADERLRGSAPLDDDAFSAPSALLNPIGN